MWNKLVLLLVLFCATNSYGLECVQGKIRATTLGKIAIENVEYCYNKDRSSIISANCKSGQCQALFGTSDLTMRELMSAYGTPGFKLCRSMGAQPQLIEFESQGEWFKLDRCIFPKDNSFIDTGSLFKKYFGNKSNGPLKRGINSVSKNKGKN